MSTTQINLLETLALIVVLSLVRFFIDRSADRALSKFKFSPQRKAIITKLTNLVIFFIMILSIGGIWGMERNQLLSFLSSVLAVIGVAFFAQWSILSNITSGFILFFNHPLKIGDYIRILDKDYPMEGIVEDISFFFLHIRSNDGEEYTIPNSVVIQKTLSIDDKRSNQPLEIDTEHLS